MILHARVAFNFFRIHFFLFVPFIKPAALKCLDKKQTVLWWHIINSSCIYYTIVYTKTLFIRLLIIKLIIKYDENGFTWTQPLEYKEIEWNWLRDLFCHDCIARRCLDKQFKNIDVRFFLEYDILTLGLF